MDALISLREKRKAIYTGYARFFTSSVNATCIYFFFVCEVFNQTRLRENHLGIWCPMYFRLQISQSVYRANVDKKIYKSMTAYLFSTCNLTLICNLIFSTYNLSLFYFIYIFCKFSIFVTYVRKKINGGKR